MTAPHAVQKMYTRTGDDGYTSLLGKGRVTKFDPHPEAYGQVDELQAALGVCRAKLTDHNLKTMLLTIERDLYTIMGELATAPGTTANLPTLAAERVAWLETNTDHLSTRFPPLTQFVLPGDTEAGALVHLARTITRRAERAVVRLQHTFNLPHSESLRYLNRLSSLLFTLACYLDSQNGQNQPTLSKTNP